MNDIPARGDAARRGNDRLPRIFISCFAIVEMIGILLLVIYLIERH